MTRGAVVRVGLVAGAALLLAGCGGDPEPRIGAAPSPSPTVVASTSTASPSPVVNTPEDAIRQWLAVDVEMQNSGDSDRFREVTSQCESCLKFADLIDGYYSAGGFVRFAGREVLSIEEKASGTKRRVFDVVVDPQPTTYQTSSASKRQTLPGKTYTLRVTVTPTPDGWAMFDGVQLAS